MAREERRNQDSSVLVLGYLVVPQAHHDHYVDGQGGQGINAAPYSHIMQYDVMQKNPRMIVGFRQESHTFLNICADR